MKAVGLVLLTCVLDFAPLAQAQRAGVIDDPAGSVDVRAEKNAAAAVIATVKTGAPFTFECENDADWCKVTLASGKSGWMQFSSIRLHFTEKDLPSREKDPAGESEIEQFAHGRKFDYAAGTRRAARGDGKALNNFSRSRKMPMARRRKASAASPLRFITFSGTRSSRNSFSVSRCRIE